MLSQTKILCRQSRAARAPRFPDFVVRGGGAHQVPAPRATLAAVLTQPRLAALFVGAAIGASILLALAGCGGSGSGGGSSTLSPPAAFSIGGTVTGLSGTLTLHDNGGDDLAISGDGPFAFATELANGASYDVQPASQPATVDCIVTNGQGTVNGSNVTSVAVTCTADATVSAMNPDHGTAGTVVTLTGTGFVPSHIDPRLNNMPCEIVSVTDTELQVKVPDYGGSGNFTVAVDGRGTAQSPLFTYDLTGVTVSTVAGGQFGYQDGDGAVAQFAYPAGVALGQAGTLFVADTMNHKIRSVDLTTGVVGTFAGSTQGYTEGAGSQIQFDSPYGVAVDLFSGTVYVSDGGNNVVRVITSGRTSSTIAAGLSSPHHLDTGYVADTAHHRILQYQGQGAPVTAVGTGVPGDVDGDLATAQLQFPMGLAGCLVNNFGLFVADTYNMKIRKIALGQVTTYTGSSSGLSYADGSLAEARFLFPQALACDDYGKLFVVDTGNNKIRMITPSGVVITLAGDRSTPQPGFADGDGASARFSSPNSIAIESNGSLLVGDTANNRIRRITWR